MNIQTCLPFALLLAACSVPAGAGSPDAPRSPADASLPRAELQRQAADVLDALHAAAAAADGARYFALFTDDAVFLGTDATERWSVAEFRAYAQPHFSQGRGWTYASTERHLSLSAAGDVAWFDERLHNEKYGEVRGSGVLVAGPAGWRIAQYNLALPVPNELAADLVARIRAQSP